MLEHISERVISWEKFVWRMARAFLWISAFIALSLAMGTLVFLCAEGLPFEDALYQASLILGEHGIQKHPQTRCGMVFVGVYVMYAHLGRVFGSRVYSRPGSSPCVTHAAYSQA